MAMVTIGRCLGSALGAPIAGYLLDAFGGPQGGTPPFRPALLVIGRCVEGEKKKPQEVLAL